MVLIASPRAHRFGYRGLNRHQVRTSSQKYADRDEILGLAPIGDHNRLAAQCLHEQPVVAHWRESYRSAVCELPGEKDNEIRRPVGIDHVFDACRTMRL